MVTGLPRRPDVFTYNAAISCCAKGGQWQLAWQLFDALPEASLQPDVVSCNASISACERGGQWQLASYLFGSMQSVALAADIKTFRAVISSFEKGAQWQKALQTFQSIPCAGLTPNLYVYNATISSCEKGSNWKMALHFFEAMPASLLTPDLMSLCSPVVPLFSLFMLQGSQRKQATPKRVPLLLCGLPRSRNAIISSCGKGGQWQLAVWHFGKICQAHLSPNTISYNSAITSCEAYLAKK